MDRLGVIFTGGTLGGSSEAERVTSPSDDIWTEVSIASLFTSAGHTSGELVISCPFVTFSENLTTEHWFVIRDEILRLCEQVEAVIVLHGTDTMTRSAAACDILLSPPFSPERPCKPVVFTGANFPVLAVGSDAVNNIAGAITAVKHLPAGVYISFCGEPFGSSQICCAGRVHKTIENQPFVPVGVPFVADVDMFGGVELNEKWVSEIFKEPQHPYSIFFGDNPSSDEKKMLYEAEKEWLKNPVHNTNIQQIVLTSYPGLNLNPFKKFIEENLLTTSFIVHIETYAAGTVADETQNDENSLTNFARWCDSLNIPVVATLPEPFGMQHSWGFYDSTYRLNTHASILPTLLTETAIVKSFLVAHLLQNATPKNYLRLFRLLMSTPLRHELTII